MALMQANSIPGQKKMMSSLVANSLQCSFPTNDLLSLLEKLIRKDGDYHSTRMMDGKDMQTNQNMQPKKKHKKSVSSNKVKPLIPQIDMDDDSSLKVQKNFICDHCYGAFRSSYHLKRHILTHTGENSQLTSSLRCGLSLSFNFSRTDRLLRHRRLCTVGISKEENQYSQDASAHPASWSPLQPSNNRLTV
uniref:C2H2-type domain-containing protein n=1 Tax=Monopterus albus TaxID=43700 RepID=A0A3Q3JTX8_MONAL